MLSWYDYLTDQTTCEFIMTQPIIKTILATINAKLALHPHLFACAIAGLSDTEVNVIIDLERCAKLDYEHRELMNEICKLCSDLNLRWRAEYPGMNHLVLNNTDDGEPWMTFSCTTRTSTLELKLVA
jgi:hypothetical protein